jgi:hypothetical protein
LDAQKAVAFLHKLENENSELKNKLSEVLQKCATQGIEFRKKEEKLNAKLSEKGKTIHNLQKRCTRIEAVKGTAAKKAYKKKL